MRAQRGLRLTSRNDRPKRARPPGVDRPSPMNSFSAPIPLSDNRPLGSPPVVLGPSPQTWPPSLRVIRKRANGASESRLAEGSLGPVLRKMRSDLGP